MPSIAGHTHGRPRIVGAAVLRAASRTGERGPVQPDQPKPLARRQDRNPSLRRCEPRTRSTRRVWRVRRTRGMLLVRHGRVPFVRV